MPERHRGNPRDFDRGPNRGYGGRNDYEGPGGGQSRGGPPGPPRGPRPDRAFDSPPMPRDRRPPGPPEEMDDYEDVDAQLAVAIIQAATKLTEIVGSSGLPEGYVERREAVVESFQSIYFSLLDAITGMEEEEDGDEE